MSKEEERIEGLRKIGQLLEDAEATPYMKLNSIQEAASDVLGFRDEMRHSQKATLDTLVRILVLMGGDVVGKAPTTQPARQTLDHDKEKTGEAS